MGLRGRKVGGGERIGVAVKFLESRRIFFGCGGDFAVAVNQTRLRRNQTRLRRSKWGRGVSGGGKREEKSAPGRDVTAGGACRGRPTRRAQPSRSARRG